MNSKLREINKILYNVKLIDCDHCDGLGMVPSDYTTAGQQFDKCKICNGYGTQEKARKVLADDLLALFERQLVEERIDELSKVDGDTDYLVDNVNAITVHNRIAQLKANKSSGKGTYPEPLIVTGKENYIADIDVPKPYNVREIEIESREE